jgi:hypothetical protein
MPFEPVVPIFNCPQGVAHGRHRPKPRAEAHGETACKVRKEQWIFAHGTPCLARRTTNEFRALDGLDQSGADGIGFLSEPAKLVAAEKTDAQRFGAAYCPLP